MKTFGIILLVLGLAMTAFTGFTIVTRKNIIDFGPVEVNKEQKTPVYWSPITGGILMIGGIICLLAGKKGRLKDLRY